MAKKSKTDRRPFWTIDCETDPFRHGRVPKPFIWGLYTGGGYHTFDTVEELIEAIKDNDVIIYAHNGGRFDFHFLLKHIELFTEIKVINGRLVTASIGACELRDSWNILPEKLASFGGKLEIDYAKLEPDVRHLHMPEIKRYLREDCVSLYNAIEAFEANYGRHLTQAGASMAHWLSISGLPSPKSNREYFDKFSQYYYGGRVQCFRSGHIAGPGKVFDIRSAYPWAMLGEHPYETEYMEFERPKRVTPASMVTLDCVSLGALPWRDDRGVIKFPCDNEKRRYHVPGHEVLAALETLTIKHVDLIHAYDFTGQKDFSVYIKHFYNIRKAAKARGDQFQSIFCKLLMNSLYGKFCANPENYGNFMCTPFEQMTDYICRCDKIARDCQCYKHDGKRCDCEGFFFDGMIGPHALLKARLDPWQEHYINVATGASITSKVRAKLWVAMQHTRGLAYCDTDSIICESAPELDLGDDLGQWADEGEFSSGHIAGKKLYWFRGKFAGGATVKAATKGVNLKASDIRDRIGEKIETDDYTGYTLLGNRVDPDDAIRIAASGERVVFNNDAPTFSVKSKPRFQTRRVRRTASQGETPERFLEAAD